MAYNDAPVRAWRGRSPLAGTLLVLVALVAFGGRDARGQSGADADQLVAPDGGLPRRARTGLSVSESEFGLVVRDVDRGSPASVAGVRVGDVVSFVDGASVRSASAFLGRVKGLRAGDSVRLGLVRDGAPAEATLTIDPVPRESQQGLLTEYSAFGDAGHRMRSLWTVPLKKASGARAAILYLHGVGAAASDTPGPNLSRDLAGFLARKGAIVVRFDAPGVGDSEGGPPSSLDFNAEVRNARAALAHVRADPRVDPDKVVIVGQGTGGGVAAVVASTDPKVAGVVVLGTIARPVMEYVLESRRSQMALARVAPELSDAYIRDHIAVFGAIAAGAAPAADPAGIVAADGTVLGRPAAFWRQYDQANFAKIYSELTAPVLNGIGEFDFVSCMGEHRAIEEALKAKGQAAPTLVVFERSDHDLRQFDTREAAYASFSAPTPPTARTSEQALNRVASWIRDNVRGALQ